ncbi:retinoic acid receptor rxr- hypothetical protein [Limosa lapponica baueri]|uniref:NR LBD domain-containing protein n=1 Tax=Limosa lapponica baueri TaxID=1758121 RepID=A0A2I0TV76_LIMLA|nr:retinoic acid receptor rxr- hypothetical protein [Limosa lapponica baueri]
MRGDIVVLAAGNNMKSLLLNLHKPTAPNIRREKAAQCKSKPPSWDSKGLSNPAEVEALREKVYASLEAYCKHKYPDQPGRFAKLLLRLPALRSIGLKCLEHLFFFKLIGDTPIDTFLMEMLEAPHQMT